MSIVLKFCYMLNIIELEIFSHSETLAILIGPGFFLTNAGRRWIIAVPGVAVFDFNIHIPADCIPVCFHSSMLLFHCV